LRKEGPNIEIHDDRFPQNARNEKWLNLVGKKNMIIKKAPKIEALI
jgi:hypothetical protein